MFGRRLQHIQPDVFASGNRGNAGRSPKITQQIKSEVKSPLSKTENIHELIKQTASRIEIGDKEDARELGQERQFFVYVQSLSVSPDIRIVLTTESLIRLYHKICTKDILYFDATGKLTLESRDFKRIQLYSLCTRHPYGISPPLPLSQYITSSHSTESLRHFIITLQEREKLAFRGTISTPKLIMTDYSLALILIRLSEFCKETLVQYINRTFKIVTGKASDVDLKKSILHICFSHVMNLNRRNLDKKMLHTSSSDKNKLTCFCMQWFARLTECRFLEEKEELVLLGRTVFVSQYQSEEVAKSLRIIQSKTPIY